MRYEIILDSKDFDQINTALPTLEPALVDPRLNVMLAEPFGTVLAVLILSHDLHPHVPELSAGQLHDGAIVEADVQQAVGDLGGQTR